MEWCHHCLAEPVALCEILQPTLACAQHQYPCSWNKDPEASAGTKKVESLAFRDLSLYPGRRICCAFHPRACKTAVSISINCSHKEYQSYTGTVMCVLLFLFYLNSGYHPQDHSHHVYLQCRKYMDRPGNIC